MFRSLPSRSVQVAKDMVHVLSLSLSPLAPNSFAPVLQVAKDMVKGNADPLNSSFRLGCDGGGEEREPCRMGRGLDPCRAEWVGAWIHACAWRVVIRRPTLPIQAWQAK